MATAFDTFNAGVQHSLEGRNEEALAAFNETLALEPSHSGAVSGRAMTLASLGRLEEAEEAFRSAVNLQPAFAENYFQLGHVQLELGNFAEGETNIRKALELNAEPAYRQNAAVRLYNLAGYAMTLAAQERDANEREIYAARCEFGERVFSLAAELAPDFAKAKEAVAVVRGIRAKI